MRSISISILLTGCGSFPLTVKPSPPQVVSPPVVASRPCLPDPVPGHVNLGLLEDPAPVTGPAGEQAVMIVATLDSLKAFAKYLSKLERIAARASGCVSK